MKYAPFPVVGAPAGMALGGGCEILLHCDAVQAHAETYMGLVEVGVGVVPGWGGCKELTTRWATNPKRPGGPMPGVAKVFETISTAQVATSAEEAREALFLRESDGITMNRDRLLADAKAKALALVAAGLHAAAAGGDLAARTERQGGARHGGRRLPRQRHGHAARRAWFRAASPRWSPAATPIRRRRSPRTRSTASSGRRSSSWSRTPPLSTGSSTCSRPASL